MGFFGCTIRAMLEKMCRRYKKENGELCGENSIYRVWNNNTEDFSKNNFRVK
jgi:hypothetical protein